MLALFPLYSKVGNKQAKISWFVRNAIGFTFSQIVLMVQELHIQAKCVPLGSFLATLRSECEGLVELFY